MDATALGVAPGRIGRNRPARIIRRERAAPNGFMLVEVMVTIVLLSIGLLGLAGLLARTSLAEMEAYQRTQALILAQDMADRIVANKANAARYLGADYGLGAVTGCGGSIGFQSDLCTWSNAIRGATEHAGALNVGTLLNGRGCIATSGANRYLVIVAWQGLAPTVAPRVECGRDRYGVEVYRRAVVVPVHLANLGGS
jgi:type IV pilus assembly protein PilV